MNGGWLGDVWGSWEGPRDSPVESLMMYDMAAAALVVAVVAAAARGGPTHRT